MYFLVCFSLFDICCDPIYLSGRSGMDGDGWGYNINMMWVRCGSETPAREGRGAGGSAGVSNQRLGANKVGEEFEVEAVCSPPLALRRCSCRPKQLCGAPGLAPTAWSGESMV